MKELRELLAKGTQGKWTQDVINISKETFGVSAENDDVIASCGGENGDRDAALIAAMHNALPELLGAWETLEALRWANDLRMNGTCDLCPFYGDDVNVWKRGCDRQCRALFEFEDEWLQAWRDAHADTKAD